MARKSNKNYNPDLIEKFALSCACPTEEILRVLYYDCAPYSGTLRLPVSGSKKRIENSDRWLKDLSRKDLFAVRRGVLKFRGFRPKNIPVPGGNGVALQDDDCEPIYEQKGVDMRIGLDIALYSQSRSVDRIALVTNDTDCIAAMKHARKSGIQMILIKAEACNPAPELVSHADFCREVRWP